MISLRFALGLMPTIPLPFCCCRFAVLLCRCAVVPLPFRSYRCRCRRERKCWKYLSVYIGMKRPERWLVVHQRQNGKKGFDPICYGTVVTAQQQVGTATAKRERQNGNGMVETRHKFWRFISIWLTNLGISRLTKHLIWSTWCSRRQYVISIR